MLGNRPIASAPIAGRLGATSTAYTLVCAGGSYTLTGQAAVIAAQRRLTAALGSYTYTGQAAGLAHGYKVTASLGAYTYTGQAATLTKQSKLVAAAGSYALTGQAAAVTAQRKLSVAAGAYTFNGNAATLTKSGINNYSLVCAAGAYAYAGNAAGLTYTPVVSVAPVVPLSAGGAGSIARKANQYRSSARFGVYIDVHAQLRREQAARDRLEAESAKPQEIAPPKPVEPFTAKLSQLGPAERANELVAQMQREAQIAADITLKRKRDDDEAIALLLLS